MSSVTGILNNQTGMSLTITGQQNPPHGEPPTILASTARNGGLTDIFIANSDGAGVEGNVYATDPSNPEISFTLFYDNPVIGGNNGSVTSPPGFSGTCDAGSGTNAIFTYTLTRV
jgi:hypothetical protein